ncbi:MAG: Rpn family recombination-promoting nuclease/putative transposase [Prevotellaceae bacterium]|jgi:predicted transposase/invertase (TIGR01784 family)|nr:Rpn family recombination-promoting nuclease/putative transposase [Prevotellaceae bacterium]
MRTTTEKYINPFTDFGFKKLFGTEVNKDLLIDFLNQIIREQGRITDIHYLQNEQMGFGEPDRRAVFDIYCENEKSEKFIVEMQKNKQEYFKERSVFYATFPIQQQGRQGNWNFSLKAVYLIGILDFVFEDDKDDESYFHREIKLMDTKKHHVFYDKLTFIYLEMPKFNKTEEELVTRFDKWLYVLKNLPQLERRPVKLQEKVFDNLFRTAEIAKFTPSEIYQYEDSVKVYRDLWNTLSYAVKDGLTRGHAEGHAKGIAEGRAKGIAEGRIEGRAQGITEGRAEGVVQERKDIALHMLNDREPVEKIMRYTGLTEEEIRALQQK